MCESITFSSKTNLTVFKFKFLCLLPLLNIYSLILVNVMVKFY